MAPYFPLTICRSDGQTQIITKSGAVEKNEPTEEQQNDTPNDEGTVDCYRRVENSEAKAVEWRRKLGGMLMHLIGGEDNRDKNYIVEELPQGYILWEHIKFTQDKVNGEKKKSAGNHAAGTLDRQDAYLYGHPHGRKKRYRSPADFFPHFLWLATDEDADPLNCSCKLCCPDRGEDNGDDESKNPHPPPDRGPNFPPPRGPNPPPRPPSLPPSSQPPSTSAPPPSASRSAAKQALKASNPDQPKAPPVQTIILPPPPPKSREQLLDRDARCPYMYRPGELIWFNKGQAWGLAVISRRQLLDGGTRPRYLLQPLSHPLPPHPPPQIRDQEAQTRPWLAWSVPGTTHAQIAHLAYDAVPWERVVRGDFGRGDAEVDGSILASKAVDARYCLFDEVPATPTPTAASHYVAPDGSGGAVLPGERHFNGMFLGAEKIWAGEAVRLSSPENTASTTITTTGSPAMPHVLLIHAIISRPSKNGGGGGSALPSETVFLAGQELQLASTSPSPYRSRAEWPAPPSLPARMLADLRFRNDVAMSAAGSSGKGDGSGDGGGSGGVAPVFHAWQLVRGAVELPVGEVRGRWYEARALLPVLRGDDFYRGEVRAGRLSDAGTWMNGRGDVMANDNNNNDNDNDNDGNNSGGNGDDEMDVDGDGDDVRRAASPSARAAGDRKANRREILGRAVPEDFEISLGRDAPGAAAGADEAEDVFPDQLPASQTQMSTQTPILPPARTGSQAGHRGGV